MRSQKDRFRRLRLQEFNDFDIERLLKQNIDNLEQDNDQRLDFIETSLDTVSPETIGDFSETVIDNSAEIIYLTSLLYHTDDIYEQFTNGLLFRKDRDVK